MIKRLSISLVLAVVMAVSVQYPALAVESPSGIEVESIMVFRNVAESDDMAVIFHYNITYNGTYPSTPASKTIAFRLYSSNGTDLLSTNKPYVFAAFGSNGYGSGVSCFYFSGSANITWGSAYRLNILGLPAYFEEPPSYTYVLSAGDYFASESYIINREEFYDYIMDISETLATVYDVELTVSTGSTNVLSELGENYFRGAIRGIQAMCPQLFLFQVYVPEEIPVEDYDMSLGETYSQRLVGTDFMAGFDRMGTHLGGISGKFVFGIAVFAGCMGICIFTMRKGWGIEPGMLASAVIGVCAAILVGDWIFAMVMIGSLVAVMGVAWAIIGKRA